MASPKCGSETWIFGYGSLIWNPDFEFDRYEIAVLSGYSRYFWQGSWTARGSQSSPGRVATITEDPNAQVWGAAIRVCPKSKEKTAAYLAERESGYEVLKCQVKCTSGELIDAEVFVARETNSQYMGPAGTPLAAAREILRSSGTTGRCLDYLVNLIASLRAAVPAPHEACDKHILDLEGAVRWTLYHQTLRSARLLVRRSAKSGASIGDDRTMVSQRTAGFFAVQIRAP